MTADKIIYDIKEQLKETVDDSELDPRYILYLYDIKRAKYLRQELNKMQRVVDNGSVQTLCIDTEPISADECNISLSCKNIVRTTKTIPEPIQLHLGSAIIRIAPANKLQKPFNFISRERAVFAGNSSFPNSVYAFIGDDNYIYITSESDAVNLLECVSISGIFQNPLDLENYATCCGCSTESNKCIDFSTIDYPIPAHLIDIIREEIVKDLLINKKLHEDKKNDSDDQD